MLFLDTIKAKLGAETYLRLEQEGDKEVACAMQMPLQDKYHQDLWYQQRFLLGDLLDVAERCEQIGLKTLPIDVVNIFFRCKMLHAAQSEEEYRQRVGGGFVLQEKALALNWSDRSETVPALVERCVGRLESEIQERTLVTRINTITWLDTDAGKQQPFFEELFAELRFPFVCFFEGDHLIEMHKQADPGGRSYDQSDAKQFFSAPSFGFTFTGSRNYCLWYSSAWLRTFFNLLRIAAFIRPGQMDFFGDVIMWGPTQPVFLGERTIGAFTWSEDKKEPWMKVPDGSLFHHSVTVGCRRCGLIAERTRQYGSL